MNAPLAAQEASRLAPRPTMDFPTFQALLALLTDCAHVVDQGEWEAWCDCFTDDALYEVVPRENHDRGLPLATMRLESRGMRLDRAYAIRETLFHDPYRQRHVVGVPRLLEGDADAGWRCESSYAVFRTRLDGESTVFNVGRYIDHVVHTAAGLRLAARRCVYDSEWIPNSLIYPI